MVGALPMTAIIARSGSVQSLREGERHSCSWTCTLANGAGLPRQGGKSVTDQHRANVTWRKSSFSGPIDCVELADGGLRDSKDPDGDMLHCSRVELHAFIDGIK